MKSVAFCFFLCFCLLTLTSCKRYPAGGLHARSAKHLNSGLTYEYEKQWELKLYEVNGIDSTTSFKKGHSNDRFSDYDVVIAGAASEKFNFKLNTEIKSFNMTLSADKTKFSLRSSDGTYNNATNCYRSNICERNIFMPELSPDNSITWDIDRLKKDEFIMSTTGINSYKIVLTFNE